MMPYDHAAAGYLLAFILIKILHPALTPDQINSLLLWSLFWAIAVDWDMIISYGRRKSLKMSDEISHRNFLTHSPLPWLVVVLLVYFLAGHLYWKYFSVAILAGAGSHLLVDSIEFGIMWLWPFSKKRYMLFDNPVTQGNPFSDEKNIFVYYAKMYRYVYMRMVTFKVGLFIVLTSLTIFFFNH